MRVLVTGASGFIGATLCRRLLADGDEVSALVRRAGSEPAGTRAYVGDLGDVARLRSTIGDARPECVVHLAAEIASQRDARKVHEVNVRGTERLLEAMRAEQDGGGAPRIVFASTVVTGDAGGRVLTEEEPLPVATPYGRSKQEGERLVLGAGTPAVIVRPAHVYGPGGWYANELIKQLRSPGRLAVIGRGDNLWDVVHVDDVVEALVLAAREAPAGSLYHVADDEPITSCDFIALTARELGLGRPRHVPVALARIVAGRNAVDAVVRSARTSNAKIKRELGWQPRFATAGEGVADAVARLAAA
ncbi:MAG TPA: NAD(P)-dependent oxidoreductase [Solirubrobacteraceae bacterium]|nr:NAD(P)-dependent oxidoreductase [Solirubrobacteraceae bacterium]